MQAETPPQHREVCYRCHKPAVVCVCPHIVRVRNKTGVVILQHAKERFHPIGTVRFARLGLENARVWVHHPNREPTSALEQHLPPNTGLLYPAQGARELRSLPAPERPKNLLVLDGTWPQARALYRLNPWLQKLPHYRLTPAQESRYKIRKEPSEECVSTIEAIIEALQTLEPSTEGFQELLSAFTQMIDAQTQYALQPNPRVRRVRPPRPSRTVPAALKEARLVVAYGEFSYERRGGKKEYIPLLWTAQRLARDAPIFQQLIRPSVMPSARQLDHMGLTQAALERSPSLESAREAWQNYIRPGEAVVVWNQSTQDGFRVLSPDPQQKVIMLKEVYCNLSKRGCGALPDVLAREALTADPPRFIGRAGRLMGQLLPVVRRLTEL